MERKSYDDPAWLRVLVEEVGEVAQALCDYSPGCEKEDRAHLTGHLREELVQVAAMACAWIDAIDQEAR
jgi:NTP pyrophosphatase (non-canonical NTP hydrolase)